MEAKAGHLRLPGDCCLLPGPGTSQAREVQGCVSWRRWWEGSLLSAHGSPWQRHILGGFCGFLRKLASVLGNPWLREHILVNITLLVIHQTLSLNPQITPLALHLLNLHHMTSFKFYH